MKTVVWKYELPIGSCVTHMPIGAKVLHVDAQNENLCLWAQVNPSETRKEARKFIAVGTGLDPLASEAHEYVGSALLYNGTLVLHVFEEVSICSKLSRRNLRIIKRAPTTNVKTVLKKAASGIKN